MVPEARIEEADKRWVRLLSPNREKLNTLESQCVGDLHLQLRKIHESETPASTEEEDFFFLSTEEKRHILKKTQVAKKKEKERRKNSIKIRLQIFPVFLKLSNILTSRLDFLK